MYQCTTNPPPPPPPPLYSQMTGDLTNVFAYVYEIIKSPANPMQPCSVRGGGGGGGFDIDSCISIISYVAWLKSMHTHKAQISTHKSAAQNLLASVSFARNNFYMHTTEAPLCDDNSMCKCKVLCSYSWAVLYM